MAERIELIEGLERFQNREVTLLTNLSFGIIRVKGSQNSNGEDFKPYIGIRKVYSCGVDITDQVSQDDIANYENQLLEELND